MVPYRTFAAPYNARTETLTKIAMMKMRGTAPYWINPKDPDGEFPDPALALTEPDGLLAIGGDLSSERLLRAYRAGIFPWYNADQPILWWSPDPRTVLFPERFKLSRSLQKSIRNRGFRLSIDANFAAVIEACSQPRRRESGTWISAGIKQAFNHLHAMGYAHSVECWLGEQLVGGIYGLSIGKVFFGESMFSSVSDASKVAFAHLVEHLQQKQFRLIDCQVASPHLFSLGAECIPRQQFLALLADNNSAQRTF